MEKFTHEGLDLSLAKHQGYDSKNVKLYGRDAVELAKVALEHSIHRQALFGLLSEITRCPVRWEKNQKSADAELTPEWVGPLIEQALASCLILGYVAYKKVDAVIIIAPLCHVDIEWIDSQWQLTEKHKQKGWKLKVIYPPDRFRTDKKTGAAAYNSPAFHSMRDTLVYDELYTNMLQRDHFNSRPSIFTTISKDLRNTNGSSRQWFQQAVSADSAAARQLNVDTSFHSLIAKRADTVQRLDELSALHRERLSSNLAKKGEKSYVKENNMEHTEHILTDGRDAHTSKQLLSLTDGEHMLERAMHDILFAYRVPPQVLGKNINSERTAVNPRLNEMALDSFFTNCNHIRDVINGVLSILTVDNAVLRFIPKVTKYDMEQIVPFVKPKVVAAMMADMYMMDASDFDLSLISNQQQGGKPQEQSKKRKASNIDKTHTSKNMRADGQDSQ